MTNRNLRRALLQKLRVTPQALSHRVQKLKKSLPLTTEDATYVIAQQEGLILDRYLDKETVDRVRGLLQHIPSSNGGSVAQSRTATERKKRLFSGERVIVIGREFKVRDPVLPERTVAEAKEMAGVYPLVYVLENSIREVIRRTMTRVHGDRWWDIAAPKGLRDSVSKRMAEEVKNSWHQRRGAHPIDYLDLNQLPALIREIEKHVVPSIIPSIEWFTQFVDEVYKSRCVICHMNPLDKVNIQALKVRCEQWQRQIAAKRALLAAD